MTHTNTYQHHVDAKYFNFLWTDAMYITVEYLALQQGDTLIVTVQNVTARPYLIGAIVAHGGWLKLMAEIDESAKNNARQVMQEREDYDADRGNDHVDAVVVEIFEAHGIK